MILGACSWGKHVRFSPTNFISVYCFFLFFKLYFSFTFLYIVVNLAKFSLPFKLNVDFTVSYSLLNLLFRTVC
jgi:hypothetical protein